MGKMGAFTENQPLHVLVRMDYGGDLTLNASDSDFDITEIEARRYIGDSNQMDDTAVLARMPDGMDELTVHVIANEHIMFTLMGSDSGTFTVHIDCASDEPTASPSPEPTSSPSEHPTADPTRNPSAIPTADPTKTPTAVPSANLTANPTTRPSKQPTPEPTKRPTNEPTKRPSAYPTTVPSKQPTPQPVAVASLEPTEQPSDRVTVDDPSGADASSGSAMSDVVVVSAVLGAVIVLISVCALVFWRCLKKEAMDLERRVSEQQIPRVDRGAELEPLNGNVGNAAARADEQQPLQGDEEDSAEESVDI